MTAKAVQDIVGSAGRRAVGPFRHVICINPYYRESSAAMGFFPPTGLEYIASAFAVKVPRVTLADLRHDPAFRPEQRLHEFMLREGVDLAAVSVNWEFLFDEALELIKRLPAGLPVIVGGQEATARVEEIFQRCPNVTMVARGEGEEIVLELASGRPLEEIAGLSFRSDGRVVHNENRVVGPIGALPPRNRSLRRVSYDISAYGVKVLGGGFDTVLTSRGCPFNCKFCSFNRNPLGRKRDYDERSAEDVFEEVRALPSDIIYFSDDNFFVNCARAEKLCDMLIASGVKKRFIAQARLELARHPRLLEKLVQAGFKVLLLGVESATDRILEQLNKGFTTAQIRRYFDVFRRYDIYYHGYFIYGNVGETEEEMLAIPRFAKELGLDSISVLRLQARRFTPIKDLVDSTPGYYCDAHGFVYSDRYSIRDLKRIGRRIKREFYTPMQIARCLAKFRRLGVLSAIDILALPFRLPRIAWRRRKLKRRASA